MHDWHAVVGAKLPLALRAAEAREIRLEIAGHLEEMEEAARLSGKAADEAAILAAAGLQDWTRLAREIRASKGGSFMARAQRWMVPGVVSFLLAAVADRAGYLMQVTPRWVWVRDTFFPTMPVHEAWTWKVVLVTLGMLPLCGAVGAWLSRRGGGSPADRVRAALMPVMCILGLFLITLPVEAAFQAYSGTFAAWAGVAVRGVACSIVSEVLLPGAALLLGALPFLGRNRQPAPRMEAATAH